MNLATKTDDYQRPTMAVAVDSLTPEFKLLCLQPSGGYPAGSIRPVYGGNLAEGSIYTNGNVPKDWRLAVETGGYESEVITHRLPDLMEEIVLEENPGQYQLILTDCRIIKMPVPTEPEVPTCKVITHPATFTAHRIEKPASKKKPDGRQLYLFPEDLQPKNQSA